MSYRRLDNWEIEILRRILIPGTRLKFRSGLNNTYNCTEVEVISIEDALRGKWPAHHGKISRWDDCDIPYKYFNGPKKGCVNGIGWSWIYRQFKIENLIDKLYLKGTQLSLWR